jgi:hypothetical protein
MAKRKKAAAKRRPTARRGKPPADPATGQLLIFNPATGAPTPGAQSPKLSPAAQRRVDERERRRKQASREWRAARKAEHDARLARRPASMQDRRYTLPADVRRFLDRLYDEPYLWPDEPQIACERVEELLREVYAQGHGQCCEA